jgi:peptidoglycan/xylan/chitin deacetylase (PgdA/CDA1 family)
MNSTTLSGDQFRIEDLHSLVADGHELASHTYHHISSYSASASRFLVEVRKGLAALQQISGLRVSRNFAYPKGDVTLKAKRALNQEMLSCRGNYHGINGPIVDLSLLRANPLYGDAGQSDFVRSLIARNEEVNGWLIFYTHDVDNSPSPYGCTPFLLETAITAALSRSMTVLTVADVITQRLVVASVGR